MVGQAWIKNPSNGHSYALQAKRMTWEQAEEETVKHGGHLVTIRSNAEQGWIKALDFAAWGFAGADRTRSGHLVFGHAQHEDKELAEFRI